MIPASESRSTAQVNSPAGITSQTGTSSLFAAKWTWILSLLLIVATVAVYYPVKDHPFANYDDDDYVTNNPHVQAGVTWETVKWSFTTYEYSNWHPLTWLSHALDCQLFGMDPGPHHETNLLLHIVNVLLLFWVLAQATGYLGRSAMVAALFALHPMNVESVAWIAERKNLLSTMFFLLALAAYRWYARDPKLGRYLTVAGLYALGLMAKPQIITLPCVLLLWDYWPLQRMFPERKSVSSGTAVETSFPGRTFGSLVLEKLPLFLLAGVSAHLTQAAQRASGWHSVKLTRTIQIGNAIVGYVLYLAKAFWPSHMALFYPHPGSSVTHAAGRLVGIAAAGDHGCSSEVCARLSLRCGWLVLVSGDDGTDERSPCERRSRHGRPLRVPTLHRLVPHGLLDGGRVDVSPSH